METEKQAQQKITNIQSIATVSTIEMYKELLLFLKSLRRFHPTIPVYIITSCTVKSKLQKDNLIDAYTTIVDTIKDNMDVKHENVADYKTERVIQKTASIHSALDNHKNVLFADCDQFFIAPISFQVPENKEIGISRHMIMKSVEQSTGLYNSGFVFTTTRKLCKRWIEIQQLKNFKFEQLCIQEIAKEFSFFEFPIQYNFGWWRISFAKDPLYRINNITVNRIYGLRYKHELIVSIHGRFNSTSIEKKTPFNLLLNLLLKSDKSSFDLVLSIHPEIKKEFTIRKIIAIERTSRAQFLIKSYTSLSGIDFHIKNIDKCRNPFKSLSPPTNKYSSRTIYFMILTSKIILYPIWKSILFINNVIHSKKSNFLTLILKMILYPLYMLSWIPIQILGYLKLYRTIIKVIH